jgi:AraC family transcriptional regulator of adaptative response/methylated-DNA-[protein]-cysteine methyltransferase
MNAQSNSGLRIRVPSNEEIYEAIKNRDARYDGRFYYGVITTGVFCQPSCSARLANRENIRTFADPESAVAAGFRACRKCRPDLPGGSIDDLIELARYIQAHADERLTLAELSSRANLSESRLQRKFKSVFGVSPKAYQDAARLGRLKSALRDGDEVTGAIFSAGYGSTSRVYGDAARSMGMTPSAYRAGGEGERICYAYRKSELGPLMMAATDRGVCFAQFGDGKADLLERLREEFPNAEITRSPGQDGPELDRWIEALDAHLSRHAPRPDVPLDLRGTAFQLKVWRFLLSIREGDIVSYAEVAAGIGKPRAVRAAASACGANRIGVLIPCHRVLRGNGGLGGYRWGTERKRTLLDAERSAASRSGS